MNMRDEVGAGGGRSARALERDAAAGTKIFTLRVAALFLIIVAVLLDLPYLYLMALSLALLPLASQLLARRLHGRFRVRREHSTTVSEGRVVPVTLQVFARGGLPQATLRVADAVPPDLRGEVNDEATPLGDWDGQQGSRTYHVEPSRRGVYRLGPTRIVAADPLGLFPFAAAVPGETEIVVHPTPVMALGRGSAGGSWFGVQEREGRARRGEGMDFHGVREWRQGDPLRRVHWPTTARTGRLSVIEFERAFQQDIVIALDLGRGTEYGEGRETTLEYAVKVAATLIEATLAEGGAITLVTQAGRADAGRGRRAGPKAGPGDAATERFLLFDLLARARAESDRSLAAALEEAELAPAQRLMLLTARADPAVTAYLTRRVGGGDTLRMLFFDPASFGGPSGIAPPAVPGGDLRVIRRGEHSPWREGGKDLVSLLRDR